MYIDATRLTTEYKVPVSHRLLGYILFSYIKYLKSNRSNVPMESVHDRVHMFNKCGLLELKATNM